MKRKSITFDDRTEKKTPEGASGPKKKFVKTPIRAIGNKGVYQPPQGKYSSGLGKLIYQHIAGNIFLFSSEKCRRLFNMHISMIVGLEGKSKFGAGRGGKPRGARGRGRTY